MLEKKISRRNMLRTTGLAVLGSTFAGLASCAPKKKEEPSPEASSSKRPFRVCLNVSTIAGYKLPVQKQIDLCAEAGFEGIELWTRDVDAFVKQGGTYETLRRQLEGSGLFIGEYDRFLPRGLPMILRNGGRAKPNDGMI